MIGKWHLKREPDGFDYWEGLPGEGVYDNPTFRRPADTTQYTGYVSEIITDRAIRWVAEGRTGDDQIGRLLDELDRMDLADETIGVYASDQGFFLGEKGWFDKRWMYAERRVRSSRLYGKVARLKRKLRALKTDYEVPDAETQAGPSSP